MTTRDRWSDVWRAPLHDFPLRDEILYQFLPLTPSSEVLEIGPGSGFTAFRLARLVRRLTVVDVAETSVEALRTDLSSFGNVRCVRADATQADFTKLCGSNFDAAFALDVFEYVTDPAACLSNLADSLRRGGQMLLSYPNVPPPVGDGVTYFDRAADLELLLTKAGFSEWEIGAVKLRPWAAALYRDLHERPLRLYRRRRARERPDRPQTYEATWAFRHGRQRLHYKLPVHLAWRGLDRLMRLGGPYFSYTRLGDDIRGHQLLIRAGR
jgi:SAM-dependent methyltransferase